MVAAGPLRLRNWGLFATVGLQRLAAVNAALLMVIPGQRARLQQLMETMLASMNAPATTGAICLSRMDRVGHGFSCDRGDSVVPHYA